ncbi:MAG: pantoate--beta-alanine ligase [Crocinitomicaceae bacterium]|nr:pantoate--beta-alanine ligase [Crocinitomicaceae bacterium]MBK8927793.1 pantoate--beta-alanine ligase [Crocinitomicaceae bacterium]
MQKIDHSSALQLALTTFKGANPKGLIGFVPTMGALHQGHIKLIQEARKKTDLVVCSIFVNPTQFNNATDLARYPRTLEADLLLLEQAQCDIVYFPTVDDVYPKGTGENYEIDFFGLDTVMEGKFRPGHFKGVARVVHRFFDLVKPDFAFFGCKDFQQVAIIKHLIKVKNIAVQIEEVLTERSPEGLALSSRNMLLTDEQRRDALIIFQTLSLAHELVKTERHTEKLRDKLISFFNSGKLKLEYLEIVENNSLQTPEIIESNCTCCIAAFCGEVRLIDNMSIA